MYIKDYYLAIKNKRRKPYLCDNTDELEGHYLK